jgi:hypothetical protein
MPPTVSVCRTLNPSSTVVCGKYLNGHANWRRGASLALQVVGSSLLSDRQCDAGGA